ncbi:MAG: hybrid sensor histidine kinase/response regulator [Deltaproteobacteria bacterium]|nr:hybrid sensor histidine kinase/response regulator [Deltaproteobacteria bacterium]
MGYKIYFFPDNHSMTTILIVDDEPNIIRSISRIIMDAGFDILTATSGPEALNTAVGKEIDICVCDYHMPGMNGTQVLSQLKTIHPDSVRILLTGGVGTDEIISAVNDASIYYFLQKPVIHDGFIKLLDNAVQFKKLNADNRNLARELSEKNRALEKMNRSLESEVRKRAGDLMEREFKLHKAVVYVTDRISGILGTRNFNAKDPLDTIKTGFEMMLELFDEKAKKLEVLNEKLNILLREKGDQLIHSERMASIGKLAAGVAHEINNPNAVIKANILILKKLYSENSVSLSDEDLQEILQRLERNSERINTIVGSLRHFSRKGVEKKMEVFDFFSTIENAVSFARAQYGDDFPINIDYPSTEISITGDSNEFTQVFLNLIINGIQSSQSTPVIGIKVSKSEDTLVVEVSDNGRGVSPEIASRIFEPFFTKGKGNSGTGLGLSISLGIIENYGGTISFRNKDSGEGTVFSVTVPTGFRENKSL